MLCEQLGELGVSEYFIEVIGLDHIKATSKLHLAGAWREEHPNAVPLFIGDTDHDLYAANAMCADCILVACGHQSFDTLKGCHDVVVHDMDELYTLLFNQK